MATSHSGKKSCINIWKYCAASMDFAVTHEIEFADRGLNMVKSACDQYVGILIDPDELAFVELFRKDERCHSENIEARRKQLSLKFSSIRQQIR
uniref:Uncharacterized protein n=1 Tax=Panagrolaimus davidi TaxID=227884 RepID=A0A914QMU9_9BILA